MAQDEYIVRAEDLKAFTSDVFERVGLSRKDAELEAEVLVWANLRGVDSHGVLRVQSYVERVDQGAMNTKPKVRVVKETPATILIDADRSFGPIVTTMVMGRVIEKAKAVGIGWGLIRNTTHQGAMAYYPLMAAREGMAGMAIVCSPPNMAIFGARAAGVHNSPIAIAVPGRRHAPLVLDMATSVAAGGKVKLAGDKEDAIPLGWALDDDGNPTTDPNLATILLPFGGPKGSGLALMFECLSSLTVGNPLLEPALSEGADPRSQAQNSVVAAIDIGTFTDVEEYKDNVDSLIDRIKGLPRSEGTDEIFVPGEPENRVYHQRVKNGIPLPVGTVRNLRAVAERFGLQVPTAL
jgi:LDH2 family malate/lactate/ureidoglycolate dehydrogenase